MAQEYQQQKQAEQLAQQTAIQPVQAAQVTNVPVMQPTGILPPVLQQPTGMVAPMLPQQQLVNIQQPQTAGAGSMITGLQQQQQPQGDQAIPVEVQIIQAAIEQQSAHRSQYSMGSSSSGSSASTSSGASGYGSLGHIPSKPSFRSLKGSRISFDV